MRGEKKKYGESEIVLKKLGSTLATSNPPFR